MRPTGFSYSAFLLNAVQACSGLGRLSHSCLSGPEQQGRCEEGDCQEAAVAGGSQSRCSYTRQSFIELSAPPRGAGNCFLPGNCLPRGYPAPRPWLKNSLGG